MTRATFLLLAAVVPLAGLWLAAPADRTADGLAVSPFGWPSLLVVHVLCAVPAGWLLARRLTPTDNPGPPVLLGVLTAGLGYLLVGELGAALEDAGFAVRAAARSLFCLLLVLPWCVAANTVRGTTDPLLVLVAVVLAVGLPAIQADRVAGQALAEAAAHVERDRLVRVVPLLAAAADVSPDQPAPGGTATVWQVRRAVATDLKRMTALADVPPPRPSVEYGGLLVKLDRLVDAEEYLTPLAAANPVARLRLGECLQLRGQWAEGDAALRSAVAEMLPKADLPHVARWCGECYDLLAESATKRRRVADREAALREALEKLPAQAGYWHLQLGRHFRLSGRPFAALEEFDLAEQADPKRKPQLDAFRRDIREQTPGCLVR